MIPVNLLTYKLVRIGKENHLQQIYKGKKTNILINLTYGRVQIFCHNSRCGGVQSRKKGNEDVWEGIKKLGGMLM